MNKLLSVGVVSLAMVLTACGGDSDSSGSSAPVAGNNIGETAPNTPKPNTPKPANPNGDTCVAVDGVIKVPKSGGCTYSSPSFNNGQQFTYTCNGTSVTNGMGLTVGKNFNLEGVKITCNY